MSEWIINEGYLGIRYAEQNSAGLNGGYLGDPDGGVWKWNMIQPDFASSLTDLIFKMGINNLSQDDQDVI